jgi:hypothetical protein
MYVCFYIVNRFDETGTWTVSGVVGNVFGERPSSTFRPAQIQPNYITSHPHRIVIAAIG